MELMLEAVSGLVTQSFMIGIFSRNDQAVIDQEMTAPESAGLHFVGKPAKPSGSAFRFAGLLDIVDGLPGHNG